MHCFCNYATCMRNSVHTAYIFVHVCTLLYVYAICTRIKIMYMCNNYVHVQQLCMRTTIIYAYNNYVCVQRLCIHTTMFAYYA